MAYSSEKTKAEAIILETDLVTPSTFITVGCLVNWKMPGIVWGATEPLVCLNDTGPPYTSADDEEPSEGTGQLIMDPAMLTTASETEYLMWALAEAATEVTWHTVFNNDTIRARFEGWIRQWEPVSVSKKDWLMYDFAIRRTSDITWEADT